MMKKIVMLALLAGFFLTPVLAQKPATAEAHKESVKTLIDYRAELGLEEAQVREIKDALTSFQVTVKTQRAALVQQEKEFKQLLLSEAPLSDLKSKLRQISDTRFNLRYADVLTSRRVNDALSEEQMKQWRAIQEKVRGGK